MIGQVSAQKKPIESLKLLEAHLGGHLLLIYGVFYNFDIFSKSVSYSRAFAVNLQHFHCTYDYFKTRPQHPVLANLDRVCSDCW